MKQRYKIGLVANIFWNIYNFRQSLVAALQKQGFELVLIAQADGYEQKLLHTGAKLISLQKLQRKGSNPLADFALWLELKRVYQREKLDLVLHFTIKPNIYGSLAAKWLRIPAISVVTGLGYTFLHENWTAKIAKFLYKQAFRRLQAVVFQNQEDLTLFEGKKLLPHSNPQLIQGSGIDCQRFQPSPNFDFSARPFVFLFVGRLLYDKGIRELLQTAEHLRKKYPNQLVFQLLGAIDKGNPAAVSEQELAQYVQSGAVSYLGYTDEVEKYLAGCHAVVLPSYREGLPRVLLEAGAMGKPIISSDAAGCAQMVMDGENGFLVKTADVGSLEAGCERLFLQASPQLQKMGDCNRHFVQTNFSDEVICAQFIRLIGQILPS